MTFKVFGSSRKGPDLPYKAPYNQDSYLALKVDDYYLLAVADGLGSKKRSHEGSRLVCEHLSEELQRISINTDQEDLALEELASRLVDSASSTLKELDGDREMSCTLTLLLYREPDWAVVTVGDSFTVLRFEDEGDYLFFSGAETSRKELNQTDTLSQSSLSKASYKGTGRLAFAATASDGLAFSSVKGDRPEPGFWSLLEREIEEEKDLQELLEYLDSKEKISDDTTLALLKRHKE